MPFSSLSSPKSPFSFSKSPFSLNTDFEKVQFRIYKKGYKVRISHLQKRVQSVNLTFTKKGTKCNFAFTKKGEGEGLLYFFSSSPNCIFTFSIKTHIRRLTPLAKM